MLQNARTMPLEVNQGHALVDGIASKIRDFSNTAKNGFVKNTADSIAHSLNSMSKNIGSKEAALNQQDLINFAFNNNDLANMARSVLANDPKIANKVANSLSKQDEALLKELKLNDGFKADELYKLREARAKRAYDEFGKGLDELDKLNPNGIKIDKKGLNDLIQNADFFGQNIPKALKDFFKELNSNAPMSATKLNTRIKELGEEIKTNKNYDFNSFLENLKQNLLDSIVKNATNPQEARNILGKIRKDYADFKAYDKSKLGEKLKGSEKDISKDINKILNETNSKKNYEAITKGLNDSEVKTLDNQIIARALDKHKINLGDENSPKFVTNYKALMKSLENYKPKSKAGQEQMEVLKSIGNMRSHFETIIDGILNSKAKELGHGISTNLMERAKTMLVNNFTDYIAFYFMRLWEVGKRAGTRIQMRRGFSNINTLKDFDISAKEFIESIKDKALKEEAREARKEFNAKVKDLVQGNGFVMYQTKPKQNNYNVEFSLNDNVKKNLNLNINELKANLHRLQEKHPEMFKTNGSVARVIKEIANNPNRYYANNKLDISLVAKDLKNGKLGKMGIVNQGENIGKIGHLSISSNKEKEIDRLNNRNKKHLGVGSPTPTLRVADDYQHGQKAGANAHSLNNPNSTQAKPKKNLIERLDEKIQNDKKASEERIEKIKRVIARKQKIDKIADKKIFLN